MTIPTATLTEGGGKADRAIPTQLRRLFYGAPWVSAAAPIAYGLSAYFVAIQVQLIDESSKEANLALINSLSAVAAMLAQPIFGVLSDRTRSRFGARRPWMLVGAVIGGLALVTSGLAPNMAILTVCVMLVQFGFNAFQAPFSALLPDRVPEKFRGRYSTGVGLGALVGAVLGPILGSMFADSIPVGYLVLTGVILLPIVLFILLVPDVDNRGALQPPFRWLSFLSAFWVNPVRYPDFFWGFVGRILLMGAYAMLSTYQLYIAQDYIGLSLAEATTIVPLFGLVALPGIIIAIAIAGPLSDRIGRRKPIVLVAGLVITLGAIVPLLFPSVVGLAVSSAVVGAGFGAFVAVDQALMSSVLPSPDSYGKDLGVLNLAATLPNTIAPIAASMIVLAFGNYGSLYVAAGIIGLLGALAILPIRGVR